MRYLIQYRDDIDGDIIHHGLKRSSKFDFINYVNYSINGIYCYGSDTVSIIKFCESSGSTNFDYSYYHLDDYLMRARYFL